MFPETDVIHIVAVIADVIAVIIFSNSYRALAVRAVLQVPITQLVAFVPGNIETIVVVPVALGGVVLLVVLVMFLMFLVPASWCNLIPRTVPAHPTGTKQAG